MRVKNTKMFTDNVFCHSPSGLFSQRSAACNEYDSKNTQVIHNILTLQRGVNGEEQRQ